MTWWTILLRILFHNQFMNIMEIIREQKLSLLYLLQRYTSSIQAAWIKPGRASTRYLYHVRKVPTIERIQNFFLLPVELSSFRSTRTCCLSRNGIRIDSHFHLERLTFQSDNNFPFHWTVTSSSISFRNSDFIDSTAAFSRLVGFYL